MPAPCWLSCGAAAAQARQPVAQLRELDLHRAFLARRVLGEDVEDQRDAVDDVDLEQLLEVALLRGRELVVEDHDVDVERVREVAQLFGLALADVGRRIGRAAPLQHRVDRCRRPRCRRAARARRATPRASSTWAAPYAGADEQRPLPDAIEVDLGRGEPAPLAVRPASAVVLIGLASTRVDVDVEHVHDGSAEADRRRRA